MTEDFLHYLWKYQNFEKQGLRAHSGELLHIIKQGAHNRDAGPDFSEGRVQIGPQIWAGNIEIHVRASDWKKHNHQNDAAYGNVILHVVYENDAEVLDKNGAPIPTLELKGKFDEYEYWRYEQLIQNQSVIPCAEQFPQVDDFKKETMLERVLVERMEQKAQLILEIFQNNKNDWNTTFYQWLARGFGLKVNAEPMLLLARSLPQNILGKHKDSLFQIEALLFGTAGFLSESQEDYGKELAKEFSFLQKKYELPILEKSIWKYAKLRPASFPDLRIAQFAALVYRSENLFSKILEIGNLPVLKKLLSDSPSTYWREHYKFGSERKRGSGAMGETFQNILIINVIIPFLFIFGKVKDEPFYRQRALDLLDQMDGENNRITRIFKDLGLEIHSAFRSQAVLQLHNEYCRPKKCLNCTVGIHLLKR